MTNDDARIKANLGTGLPLPPHLQAVAQAQSHKVISKQSGITRTFSADDIKHEHTVYIKDCSDCSFTIDKSVTFTKLFIESCTNLTLRVDGRIITHTIEMWKCSGDNSVTIDSTVQTFQLDLCRGGLTTVHFNRQSDFNRLIWSAMDDFRLTFGDFDESIEASSQKMLEANPNVNVDQDQFIVRLLFNKLTNETSILNEMIVRLENGFPTTEREAREFEVRQEANLQKLAKELLGDNVVLKGNKKPEQGRNEVCNCGSGKKYKKCHGV